jgi:hypothetical protein
MKQSSISALPSDTTFINTPSFNRQTTPIQTKNELSETVAHFDKYWTEAHEYFQLPDYFTISNLFDKIWIIYQTILTFWIPIKLIKKGN